MSLGKQYRNLVREKLGLSEEGSMSEPSEPDFNTIAKSAAQDAGTALKMDENTLNSILEYIQNEIAQREANGEGMEDPEASSVAVPEVGTTPSAPEHADLSKSINALAGTSAPVDASMVADDVYLEMLNDFKKKVSTCEDEHRKKALTKCYNHLYKLREKMISEMIAGDEAAAQ